MEWEAPWFMEIDLDAEIGVTAPDAADPDLQDRMQLADVGLLPAVSDVVPSSAA